MGSVGKDDGEVMADHDLGKAVFLAELFEEFAKELFADDVDTGDRFVEDEEFGVFLKSEGEKDTLEFAAGEDTKPSFEKMFGLDHGQHVEGFLAVAGVDAEPEGHSLAAEGHEIEDGNGHAAVELETLRDVSDAGPAGAVKAEFDPTGEADLAEDGHEEGGFSRTVGTDQAGNAAFGDQGGDGF